jgi:RNA polymerase sigma-70 factor, ECF subfamily
MMVLFLMSIHAAPGPNEDEAEIATDFVRRIASGDASAEGELVERYSRGVLYLLRRLAPELADDLHQETFRVVLERLRRRELDEPEGLGGFLRGIARNLVIAERRKSARRRTEADDEELAQAIHPAPGQLSAVLLDEEAETVRHLIRELPTERDRQLLLRYYVSEEDKESLCTDLGLDSLHFNRVLFRARQRFKELFLERRKGAVASP